MDKFWSGFEKRAYSWKAQAIGSGASPIVGAALGAHGSEATPTRGAIMGGMGGVGAGVGSAGGKAIGDIMKEIAAGNPEKLKRLQTLGKYMPLILGLTGASMGSFKAMKWLAGLRDESPQRELPAGSLAAKSTGP